MATESGVEFDRLTRGIRSRSMHLSADVAVISTVEILYLMTLQPGWWGIGISLGLMCAALAGAAWMLGRGSTGGAV